MTDARPAAETRPEVWLRGAVAGIPPALQPVAHSLLQVQEELHALLPALTSPVLAARPGGAASIAFHVLHLAQATDRLLTYARGESLSVTQREALRAEAAPPADAFELLRRLDETIAAALAQVAATDPSTLAVVREVGGKRLPATVGGLLFHAAEHAQRHAGQAVTTAKVVLGLALAHAPSVP